MEYAERIAVLDWIRVGDVHFDPRHVRAVITISSGGVESSFRLIFTYSGEVGLNQNLAGLIATMPAINYTLFSRKLILDFPVTDADLQYIRSFVGINNREVFINKLARRRYEFFRKEFLPGENDMTPENATGITVVDAPLIVGEEPVRQGGNPDRVAVLSSGGKESLLSYGMLREAGADVYPFYFNESGGHWLTARTAYGYHITESPGTIKVWSNVDRLYRFMLRNLPVLDPAAIARKVDTYPVRLFIFPVYIMSMIPVAMREGIGSAVMGDEFDDPREMLPFHGMDHYYGIFDQTDDFNRMFSSYMSRKGIGFRVWSAVYPISGSLVERILVNRYPELFRLQRSCHSCVVRDGGIRPCGRCSKCLGIMMFVMASGGNPGDILYSPEAVSSLEANVERERMRLDTDELNLMKSRLGFTGTTGDTGKLGHVDGTHLLPGEKAILERIPMNFRQPISSIIGEYSAGEYRLEDGEWAIGTSHV